MSDLLLNLPEDVRDEDWFIEPRDRSPENEFQRQKRFLRDLKKFAPAIDAFAVPNAGKSTEWERIRRWNEGARSGVLDLVITWNRGVMFAEFKDKDGMPTPAQRERLNLHYRQGHHCGVYRKPETLLAHLFELGAPFLFPPQPGKRS